MKRLVLLTTMISCLSPALASAQDSQPKAQTVTASRLVDVPVTAPDGDAKGLVIYLSDRKGWRPADDVIVKAMRDQGNVVLSVDFAKYAAQLDADTGQCLYVVGELTDLAQTAQRQLGIQTYLPPVIAGSGEGATFAYAALADAPVNTLGGAIASGFANRLTLKEPFCPGATATKTADGSAFSYGFDSPLPDPAYLFVEETSLDAVQGEAKGAQGISFAALDSTDTAQQIVDALGELATTNKPFGDLPAVDLPAGKSPEAVAVLVSGDGGWRDLDKTIGEWLSGKGVHVVGLDALHYFWAKRTPEELARDVTKMLERADPTKKLPVMLIGYSFGADTLPFAYPLLPPDLQKRTKVIGLMAPGQTTSFQVTISGWLGIDDSGYDIPAAIAKLPAKQVLCIYGEEEDDSACLSPSLANLAKIKTTGGHHFDGDYEALGQKMLDQLKAAN
ncbi:AcvB/VirJ family lysyl-phosphatidylglycerol hydrolase [Hoeflea sp. 108]|jgi:type IV secretory pathway VirJ component|uniref:virulence factor family protein n=1 Tax=Hoeflea sp. 108 TaxID=1116369 RepID=UPI00037F4CC0|nr:AcvB/VirJ family lysyl-phosphatidylglycerol hydrolase [Hoeflea sp. 108]